MNKLVSAGFSIVILLLASSPPAFADAHAKVVIAAKKPFSFLTATLSKEDGREQSPGGVVNPFGAGHSSKCSTGSKSSNWAFKAARADCEWQLLDNKALICGFQLKHWFTGIVGQNAHNRAKILLSEHPKYVCKLESANNNNKWTLTVTDRLVMVPR